MENTKAVSAEDKVVNPHDLFVKKILSDKNNAIAFLRDYLPANLVTQIDLSMIKVSKDTFVSEALKPYYSDLLFEFDTKGEATLLYILFEHKSYSDKELIIQLLKYQYLIYDKYTTDNPDWEYLPPIIPFVLYHGTEKWKVHKNFSDYFKMINPIFREFVLNFRYILCNLADFPDEEIKLKGNSIVQLAFYLLKHIFDNDEVIKRIFSLDVVGLIRKVGLENKAIEYIKVVTKYLLNYIENAIVQSTLKESLEKTGETIYMTVVQEIKTEFYATEAEKIKLKSDQENKIKTVKNMLNEGLDIKLVSKVTELSTDEIKKIKREMS